MEITPFNIYLLGIADSLQTAFLIMTVGAVALTLPAFICAVNDDMPKKWSVLGAIVASLFGLGAVLTPTKDTLAMMFILPKIADSEVIRKDVPEVYDIAIDALKSHLKKKTAEAP